MKRLFEKYNVPAPRYTSYPTVPYWETRGFSLDKWKDSMIQAFWKNGREVSLYIHLPFCESLCTYCGCHTYITKNHSVELPYIEALLKEWQLYVELLPAQPILKEIHLGGGTPTFFAPDQLASLIAQIQATCEIPVDKHFSLEGHPRNTTGEHLELLRTLGFDRLSLGIQDFDPEVQKTINRIQTFDQVREVTLMARELGYSSVNYDLIYGLPKQSEATIESTFEKVVELDPDRIAFYSYAHVPSMKPAQKSFEQFLPHGAEKMNYYLLGRQLLRQAGYEDIGMDHFAKPDDELFTASHEGTLHRNFMGYTTEHHHMLIGLGISAIGDCWDGFVQNHKDLKHYREALIREEFPILKGHNHDEKDLFHRQLILDIMCKGQVSWTWEMLNQYGLGFDWALLDELENDELINTSETGLSVTLKGRRFLRNIAAAFDARLQESTRKFPGFSKAV